MCGIAGFVAVEPKIDTHLQLELMANTMVHRGPDDVGYYSSNYQLGPRSYQVGLAHRRLSIIDLSQGHQPMSNKNDSLHIVFNGEIYNYQSLRKTLIASGYHFKTNSDTETILHAYDEFGPACVEQLRGMFAFAIWDTSKQTLFLARDRYGKKPLYFVHNGHQLVFASEIKALLKFPGVSQKNNPQAVWEYLAYRYIPQPMTLFQGVHKLLPGCHALWQADELKIQRYFTPNDQAPYQQNSQHTPASAVKKFRELLEESVRIRMVSDVPFGAFLSGGIDSSAIVALMNQNSSMPINTFSVGFAEGDYSELKYARVIADQFHCSHHELQVSADSLMQHLPNLIGYRDAPVSEPSDIPIYLLAVEARKSVKMVLTGEGSDEVLGGYPKHLYERLVPAYQNIPNVVQSGLIDPLISSLPYRFRRAKTAVANLTITDWKQRMPRWFGALNQADRVELFNKDFLQQICQTANEDDHVWMNTPSSNTPLRKILYFDQTSWLPDNLLERGDRMSMAASLEARMPFMDHKLAEFVSTLPDSYRIRGMKTKWILRQALQSLVPLAIINRPKVGFRVPINLWFRTNMKDYLYEHLLGQASQTIQYYRRETLLRYLNEHSEGRHNHEKLLWTLLNLELWHQQYSQNKVADV